jgi:hypothetical protein
MEKLEYIAIKVPPALKQRIETIAKTEGTTISDIVREALNVFLDKVAEFTPLGSMQLQKLIIFTTFIQLTYLARIEAFLYQLLIEQAVRVKQWATLKGDLEMAKEMNESIEKLRRSFDISLQDIDFINKAMDLIGKGDWNGLFNHLSRKFGQAEKGKA